MLIPLMWFIFDESWPAAGAAVYMTPTKVWGPLSFSLGAFLVFYPEAVLPSMAGMLGWYLIRRWLNPNFRILLTWKGNDK